MGPPWGVRRREAIVARDMKIEKLPAAGGLKPVLIYSHKYSV
jgi:hypothetical protein